ncbi:palmitoyltransferase ZDHHC16-like [Lampetra fluviatilis]
MRAVAQTARGLGRLCAGSCGRSRGRGLGKTWAYTCLALKSLVYNSFSSYDTMVDALFEPLFWLVDRLTRWFGLVFVALVVGLTSCVVVVGYVCVLPAILAEYGPAVSTALILVSNWFLIMIVFHYYKGLTTSPGYPPSGQVDLPAVSICKRCIAPKPPRTHHCSICNRCILKMDHHCPWLNNCVGNYNHRYFFSFCLYMSMGCAFTSITLSRTYFRTQASSQVAPSHSPLKLLTPASTTAEPEKREDHVHNSIVFVWVLTSTVSVVLGALTLWHAALISRGETSVERHINRKERTRLHKKGKVFRNPYHFGSLSNWKQFFGVKHRSHWLTRVLLPSGHAPQGNGLVWLPPDDWVAAHRHGPSVTV